MSASWRRRRTLYARCQSVTLAHQRPDEGDIRLQDMSKYPEESKREFKGKIWVRPRAGASVIKRVNAYGPSVSSQSSRSTSPLNSSCHLRVSSSGSPGLSCNKQTLHVNNMNPHPVSTE
ncbi:unnamed protein product [Pleuronectes platessa]|uniref:Uncharacterized protein n=1 Tax=Pleuronectes platessa TaxID=8262 RepID=A0A9N7YU81_PLEPL|nr:unnamed protein product [Pleuronectes platessa]